MKKIRGEIDRHPDFFDQYDWENIEPKGGRRSALSSKNVTAESFFIKPIAAWVPDKLFVNHVPTSEKNLCNNHGPR